VKTLKKSWQSAMPEEAELPTCDEYPAVECHILPSLVRTNGGFR
jgi:hypothetical protein